MIKTGSCLILFFIFLTGISYGEINYSMEIRNGVLIDHKTYEFEIFIKANYQSFILTSYQCVFFFNPSIINTGFLTFTYIQGTSQLNNKPDVSVGVKEIGGVKKLTFASKAGNDIIYLSDKRIGKFRLKSTTTIGGFPPAVKWCFEKISQTLITSDNFLNITQPYFHGYSNIGIPIYMVPGWNFFSIPLRTANMSVISLFPNAISGAFAYTNHRYTITDTLKTGTGYYININQLCASEIKGTLDDNPIEVFEGWNLIGPFHFNILKDNINSNPANIIHSSFFGPDYQPANYLEAGKAYWVNISSNGYLMLNSSNQNP